MGLGPVGLIVFSIKGSRESYSDFLRTYHGQVPLINSSYGPIALEDLETGSPKVQP